MTTHLSSSSHQELSSLDAMFNHVSTAQDAIKRMLHTIGPKARAILVSLPLLLALSQEGVSQSSQSEIDKKKATVLQQQKPLFIDGIIYLNKPETHNWAYTKRQEGKTTKTSTQLAGSDATLKKLLDRNKSDLPNDNNVLLQSQMKEELRDTISSMIMTDVIKLVTLASDWYKDKESINKDVKDMEAFPMLGKVTLSVAQDDLFLKNDTLVVDKKAYKDAVKKIAKTYKAKSSDVSSSLAGYIFDKKSSKDFSAHTGNKVTKQELERLIDVMYKLSIQGDRKLLGTNIRDHINVLTNTDIQEYLTNPNYTQSAFLGWMSLKTKLLPLLKNPQIASKLENIIFNARKTALTQYKDALGSNDRVVRENAKAVMITTIFTNIMEKVDPEIDKFLEHTKTVYTTQKSGSAE